jgi:hypothetical protein
VVQKIVSHLLFHILFTESFCGVQLLRLPPFFGAFSAHCPVYCMFLFSSLFIIQVFFFFCGAGVSLSGGYDSLSQVAWESYCFLSVTWHREALYRPGVWDFKVLLMLGVFFLPSVASTSQQDF